VFDRLDAICARGRAAAEGPAACLAMMLVLQALAETAVKRVPDDALAIRRMDRGIGAAVEDDRAHRGSCEGADGGAGALPGHRGKGRGNILCGPRRQAGMGTDDAEDIGISLSQDYRHRDQRAKGPRNPAHRLQSQG